MFDRGASAVFGSGSRRWLLATGAVAVVVAAVPAPPRIPHCASVVNPATQLTTAAAEITDTTPPALAALAAGPASIGDALIGFYLTVEPWTQYGADLASWTAGWVPFLGLLAPQINFFYTLDEAITRSLVFNTAYLLDGTVDVNQALSNIGSATSTAWHDFVNTEVSWLHGLLPPPPPSSPSLDSLAGPDELAGLAGLPGPLDPGAPDLLGLVA